ncbi:MAG: SPW repeat protein [Bryobacteraceae bacterium]
MTPKERMHVNAPMRSSAAVNGAKAASVICLLAGIWFFVSPWVYGAGATANAWNSWIVGAVIFILGCARAARPASNAGLSWLNALLGVWAFFSPWIYGYTGNEGRFANSLCVGVIVFVSAIAGGMATARTSRTVIRTL